MKDGIRVRFAPSPTGLMHLGNIRIALMNYLFAAQKNGAFVLRIEDTDPNRIFDPGAQKIITDLRWLGLAYNEGPVINGPYAPYFQSERAPIYKEKLLHLIKIGRVYRCFCSQDELGKKRARQIALKLPPRYDKTCTTIPVDVALERSQKGEAFVWRFALDANESITITDMARGNVTFEMRNFSDFPLTRQDGTFTFMFANFVDDMTMKINYVLRGEDHLSNTAGQAALCSAFKYDLPIFWHLPIICNINGKKLSKRDFGFSLVDLREAGYLPEAIINYLGIIGTGSFTQEIMSLPELVTAINFEQISTSGQVRYDVEKLNWINRKWIERLSTEELYNYCHPILKKIYPQSENVDRTTIEQLLKYIQKEMVVLDDCVKLLNFYFVKPEMDKTKLEEYIPADQLDAITSTIKKHIELLETPDQFVTKLKEEARAQNIPLKYLFWFIRLCLTGQKNGPTIAELITLLGTQETLERLQSQL